MGRACRLGFQRLDKRVSAPLQMLATGWGGSPGLMRSRASGPVSFGPFGSGRDEGAENIYVAGCSPGGPALFGGWARDSRDGLKAGG
jgi:hypothetical protein